MIPRSPRSTVTSRTSSNPAPGCACPPSGSGASSRVRESSRGRRAASALDEQLGQALQEEHHGSVGADKLVEAKPNLRERLCAPERQPDDRDVPGRPELADGRWDLFIGTGTCSGGSSATARATSFSSLSRPARSFGVAKRNRYPSKPLVRECKSPVRSRSGGRCGSRRPYCRCPRRRPSGSARACRWP